MNESEHILQPHDIKLKKAFGLKAMYVFYFFTAGFMAVAPCLPMLKAARSGLPVRDAFDPVNCFGFLAMGLGMGMLCILGTRKEHGVRANKDGVQLSTWFGTEHLRWEDIAQAEYHPIGYMGVLILKSRLGDKTVQLIQFQKPGNFILLVERHAPWAVTWNPGIEFRERRLKSGRMLSGTSKTT